MTQGALDPSSPRRCTAHTSQTKERCKKAAMNGQSVCRSHGGAAPQTVAKAKRRLEEAADRMAARLLGLAENDLEDGTKVGAYVQLGAVTAALDRAGVIEQKQLAVEVTAKPFEDVFSALVGGSLADYRRSVGDDRPVPIPERPDPLPVLDVDVIESEPDSIAGESSPTGDDEHQAAGLEPATESLGNAPLALPGGKPGYLDTETALSRAREANAKRQPIRRR